MAEKLRMDDVRRLLTAAMMLGVGLGGFVDGIVFHPVLQLHSMLSALYPPTTVLKIEYSMIWDGLFHAFTWAMTALGIALLWRSAHCASEPWATRTLVGGSLIGWGLFNAVEGIVDHFVLQIHHVVERQGLSVWDWAFLGSGVVLIAAGALIVRSGSPTRIRAATRSA